ncbi:MAG: hypothetical protein L3J83_07305 [Proteobacteria bacterium]|nr:hypothetical protein [Pseudomonadota bacterium]
MKKIILLIITLSFSLTACGGFLGSKTVADNTESPNKDFDTVNGSIKVGHNAHVGDLSTVNGTIKVASMSKVGEASTVNGSVVFGSDVTAQSAETVNGSIKLGENCKIETDVETVNGSVTAKSGCNIGGDFETVNGKLKATNTKIHGSVEAVNGSIILLDRTVVYDDVIIRKNKSFFNSSNKKKPKIVLGKDVVVKGDLEFGRPVILYVHDSVDIDDDIENAEIHNYSGDDLPY